MPNSAAAELLPEIDAPESATELDLSRIPAPERDWVIANPDQAMAFFFISPRPCDSLETLMNL